jgi:hypothetical protein
MSEIQGFKWARRVEPEKIRRLYTLDAKGIVDEELIDEVGYAMYARCESIRIATEAHAGRPTCHKCRGTMEHRWKRNEPMVCESCGWTTTWGDYLKTYQRKQLYGGKAYPIFLSFLEDWPNARSHRDRLLLIDRLIHAVHAELGSETSMYRPAAVNLIEGTAHELVAFLDDLAYGDKSTPGLLELRDAWRTRAEHAGWRPPQPSP